MRILLVNPAYEAGYEPEALLDRYDTLTGWGEALLGAGAAEVVTLQRFDRDLDLMRNGVRYLLRADTAGPRPEPRTRPRRLLREVAHSGADLVHANGLVFPALLCQLRGAVPSSVPMVLQHHAGPPPRLRLTPRDVLRRLVWRRALAGAAAALFTSAEQAEPWRAAGLLRRSQKTFGIPESSRVVRSLARPATESRTALPGKPAVLWVGRLAPVKDPATVLEGFAMALPSLPQAQLSFVHQDDTLLDSLRQRVANDPALASHVQFLGALSRDALAEMLLSADFFVLGSHDEGSGYALIEALACGIVPVVTDIPAFRALTAGGAFGMLWRPGDAAAFARGLVAVATRPIEPQREAVRRHFEAELSWPAIGRRALSLYCGIIAERR